MELSLAIKTLLDPLNSCPHFLAQDQRQQVMQLFDDGCHVRRKTTKGTFLIEGDAASTIATKLIKIWLDYPGTFDIYIEAAEIFDSTSQPLNNLIKICNEILDPRPNPCVLDKDKERHEWIIRVEGDELYRIPTSISMRLDEKDLLSVTEFRPTWKDIHTLCDNFLTNYIPVYNHIIRGNAEDALKKLQSFDRDCETFCNGLDSLTHQEVFCPKFEPIFHLRIIRNCTMPLQETIRNGQGTTYFALGQEFAEYILTQLVLQSLSMADRILSRSMT